jgi:drug/metabolite transporter (DMT)-like permease
VEHSWTRKEDAPLAGGIFQIFVGLVAIVFGFTADAFYPTFMRRPRPDEKPMPKWAGRAISVVVGVIFILSGFSDIGITNSPTVATGFFQIFMGVLAIVLNLMRRPNEKVNWLARSFFVVVGAVFVVSGISGLRHH